MYQEFEYVGGKGVFDRTLDNSVANFKNLLGQRIYDPSLGRWVRVDPLADKTGMFYQYYRQNPINLIDPTGMSEDDWYQNNETGDYEYWEGSEQKEGYKHLGASSQINVNDSSGNQTATVNLNANGTADYVQGDNTTTISNATVDPNFKSGNMIRAGDWGLSANLMLGGNSSLIGTSSIGLAGIGSVPFPKLWLQYTPEWFHGGYGRGWVKGLTDKTSIASFGSRRLGLGGEFGRALPGNLFKGGMYQLGAEALYDGMLINSDSDILKRFDNNQRNNPHSGFVIDGFHLFRTDNKQNLIQKESLQRKQEALRKTNPALYDMGTSGGY